MGPRPQDAGGQPPRGRRGKRLSAAKYANYYSKRIQEVNPLFLPPRLAWPPRTKQAGMPPASPKEWAPALFSPPPLPHSPPTPAHAPQKKSPAGDPAGACRGCKPISVPLRAPIITLSTQPADSAPGGRWRREQRLSAYLGLLRKGFAVHGGLRPPPVVSYTAFSPLPPGGRRFVSVALSVARVCPAPAGHCSRPSRSVESGLSSRLRGRLAAPAQSVKSGCGRTPGR